MPGAGTVNWRGPVRPERLGAMMSSVDIGQAWCAIPGDVYADARESVGEPWLRTAGTMQVGAVRRH